MQNTSGLEISMKLDSIMMIFLIHRQILFGSWKAVAKMLAPLQMGMVLARACFKKNVSTTFFRILPQNVTLYLSKILMTFF